MSIYTDCSAAARRIMVGEDRYRDNRIEANRGDVFSEIDVVNEARKRNWGKKQFSEAKKKTNIILSTMYRDSQLVRYGPVDFRDTKDYARIASMIVYGHPQQGPKKWKTPNGSFPQMFVSQDPLRAAGRNKNAARDDLAPWSEQVVTEQKNGGRVASDDLVRRIEELQTALAERDQRISQLEEEKAKVSELEKYVREIAEDTVLTLLSDKAA